MAIKADEVKHPDQIEDDFDWGAVAEGERPDSATRKTLNVAHRAVAKFPELKGKYKAYAGAAAIVSSALTLTAGTYWVSIQGSTAGDSCWFLWLNSVSGLDSTAYQLNTMTNVPTTLTRDQSMCINVP